MGILADEVKKRSPYLQVEDGESVVAIYRGFKMVPSSFNPEEDIFRFTLGIGEEEKFWDTGSNKVAMVFDHVKEGEEVKITKSVVNGKNNWKLEPVKKEEPFIEGLEKEKKAKEDKV